MFISHHFLPFHLKVENQILQIVIFNLKGRVCSIEPPPSLNIIVNINQFGLYGEHDWSILLNWSINYQIFPMNILYHTKYSEAIFG